MHDATLCIPVIGSPPERILLGYKKIGFGKGRYTGFGGKVEPGESIEAAALRETQEEAGIVIKAGYPTYAARLTFIFPAMPTWSQHVHVFLASAWDGVPAESDEMIPSWFCLEEIPYGQMWVDAAHWLPPILTGRKIIAEFVFHEDNETLASIHIEQMPVE